MKKYERTREDLVQPFCFHFTKYFPSTVEVSLKHRESQNHPACTSGVKKAMRVVSSRSNILGLATPRITQTLHIQVFIPR